MNQSFEPDKCQLYTRAAHNILQKRNQFKAKLEDFDNIINIDVESEDSFQDVISESLMDIALKDVESEDSFQDVISESLMDIALKEPNNHQDEQTPNRVQTRSSRRGKSINCDLNVTEPLKRAKKTRANKTKKRRTSCNDDFSVSSPDPIIPVPVVPIREPIQETSQNENVVVLDDDSEFANIAGSPIEFYGSNFNRKKPLPLDKDRSIISLTDEISDDEDEPVVITIEWNNGRLVSRKQFELRKYQKFESIFSQLANIEGLPTSRISLKRDLNIINPADTPDSLNLKYYAGLTGSISTSDINYDAVLNVSDQEKDNSNKESIKIKVKLESQKTLHFSIMKHQKMNVLYKKCSEELKCHDGDIKLTFDGDYIDPQEQVSSLDIEDGDIFNVHFKKVT